MEFEIGKQATLGGEVYEIKKLLGGGAVAAAYLATPVSAPNSDVVIKILRDDDGGAADKQKALEGMRNEIKVLQALNAAEDPAWSTCQYLQARLERARKTQLHRRIVTLLDSGEIDERHPFQIQEKAPPAIELVDFKIKGVADELRLFNVVNATLEAIALAHRNGFALRDFEPNTKWDRLRLKWLNAEQTDFELKIIDWNITGTKEDFAQDLLYFGGHLFRLLFKRDIVFEKGEIGDLPPRDLAAMTHEWNDVTEGTRQILQRLLSRDPERRYLQAENLQRDCHQWSETLKDALSQDAFHLLQDRLWDLKRDDNFSGIFAAADLALRVLSTDEEKNAFQIWREQARVELEKREFLPIAYARGSLLIGAYEKAALEFEKELANLQPDSETARQAAIYAALARAGAEMKKAKGGADIRETTEWLTLERGAQDLINRNVERALLEFTATLKAFPQSMAWDGFRDLHGKAMAIRDDNHISEYLAALPPNPENPVSDEWLGGEREQIETIGSILERFTAALNYDPKNAEIRAHQQDEQERLARRRKRLGQYRQIDGEINNGLAAQKGARTQAPIEQISSMQELNTALLRSSQSSEHFQNAAKICEDILRVEPAQTRAANKLGEIKLWLAEEEKYRALTSKRQSYLKNLDKTETLLLDEFNADEYEKARKTLNVFRQEFGAVPAKWEELAQAINFAAKIENDLRAKCRIAQDYLPALRGAEAEELLKTFSEYDDKRFGLLTDGGDLSDDFRGRSFRVSTDVSKLINDARRILPDIKKAETAQGESRLTALQTAQKALVSMGLDLNEDFREELERLRTMSSERTAFVNHLVSAKTFGDLEKLLVENPGIVTREFKNNAAERWRALLDGLTDLPEFRTLAKRGVELFPERADFKIDINSATTLIDVRENLLGDAELWKDYPHLAARLKDYESKITDIKEFATSFLRTNAETFWNDIVAKHEAQIEKNFGWFHDQANQFGGRKNVQSKFAEWVSYLRKEILSSGLRDRIHKFEQEQNKYLNIAHNLNTYGASYQEKLSGLEILPAKHEGFFNVYENILFARFGAGDTNNDQWFQEKLEAWYNAATSTLKNAVSNLIDGAALQHALDLLGNFGAILNKLNQLEYKYQARFSDEISKSAQKWLALKPEVDKLNELKNITLESLSLAAAGTNIKAIHAALKVMTDLTDNTSITADLFNVCAENLLPLHTLLDDEETKQLIRDGDFQKALTKLESGQKYVNTLKISGASRWLLGTYQDYLRNEHEKTLNQCKNGLQAQVRKYLEQDLNSAAENIRKEMMLPCGVEASQADARIRTRSAVENAVKEVISKTNDKGSAIRVWQAVADAVTESDAREWQMLRHTALAQIKSLKGLDPKWRWGLALAGTMIVFIAAVIVFITWSNANWQTANAYSKVATANAGFTQTVAVQVAIGTQQSILTARAQQAAAFESQTAQVTIQTAQAAVQMTQAQAQICAMKTYETIDGFPALYPPPGSHISDNSSVEITASWVVHTDECSWDASKLKLSPPRNDAYVKELRVEWTNGATQKKEVVSIAIDKNWAYKSPAIEMPVPKNQDITITIVLADKSRAVTNYDGTFYANGYWLLDAPYPMYRLNLSLPPDTVWIKDGKTDIFSTYSPTPIPTLTVTPLPTSTLMPTPPVAIPIP